MTEAANPSQLFCDSEDPQFVREARACWLPHRNGDGSDGQRYTKAGSGTAKNSSDFK